jgi:hypothetical protein
MPRFAVAFLAVVAGVASANAQDPRSCQYPRGFFEYIADETRQNNRWPYPYSYADRQAEQEPFAIMVQNGWRRQNLLADHYFQEKTGQLTEAGQAVIRRIANEAPAPHRTIYVRKGQTPEQTAARINAVQQYAAKAAVDGNVPPIVETSISPAGYPAGWPPVREGAVSRKFQVWVPDKIYLPESSTGGGKQ